VLTVVVLGAVVLLLVIYAFWTARRLDRLHARLDAAAGALDDQLQVRAEAAARFALDGELPRESVAELAQAAEIAAEAPGLGHDREAAENTLSRALSEITGIAGVDAAGFALADAVTRASFARRFHNDAVRDVLVVRRRRIVRYLRLAGRAPLPAYFEIVEPVALISQVSVAAPPYH
jgi:ABC-type transporter Mla MlaB component